jgi:hypothetical protein
MIEPSQTSLFWPSIEVQAISEIGPKLPEVLDNRPPLQRYWGA